MSNRMRIKQRVVQAAEQPLNQNHFVSPVDILIALGWLQPIQVQDWRKGKIPYLEKAIQANLNKISYAMKCFRLWSAQKELKTSETAYLARTRGSKKELQFSISGHPRIEQAYRTHHLSPQLS